ncbi:MAG: PhzF family phenazine biosynthesis protein [Sphingomonas sp.]
MTRLPFAQIDAFAEHQFTGNPAAVMPLDAWLDDDVLQAIAEENNLSETAFLVPCDGADDGADYDLRWFTPGAEIALCGHATLASGHYVLSADPERARVRFRTRQAGVLEVARDPGGYALALPAWPPQPKPLPGIVAALGVSAPVATLWHDRGYALIIAQNEADVRSLAPDLRALAQQGPIVAVVSARGQDTDIVSRVFTPAYNIDEDPVTGSAHAVCVPYWAQMLGRNHFSAFQASRRGGKLGCQLNGETVTLIGNCVTVIEGSFLL